MDPASPCPAPSPSTDPPPSDASPSASIPKERYTILDTSPAESWEALQAACSTSGHPEIYPVNRSGILCLSASITCDPNSRLEQLNEALGFLHQALSLSPNSISLVHRHAKLLFELARQKEALGQEEAGSYDIAAVQECERAFLIKNPMDPIPVSASRLEKIVRNSLVELTEKSKRHIIVLGGGNRRDKWERLVEDNSLAEVKAEFEATLRRKMEIVGRRPSLDDRFGKKRKFKKVESNDVATISRVRAFWNDNMSVKNKRELLRIGIKGLKAYLDKNKLRMAKEVLTEAIDFAKKTKKGTWMFWECCCCKEKLCDKDSPDEHISGHLGVLSESFQSIVPVEAPEWAVNMVENGVWKPVESTSAAEIMERLRSASANWPYIYEKSERAEIIDRIRAKLQLFTRNQCLAWSHLKKLQSLIIELLQNQIPKLVITDNNWLHHSLPLICFLEVPELNSVLEFLEDLAGVCALGCLGEITWEDDGVRDNQLLLITPETIDLSCDKSALLLDDMLLRGGDTDLVSWLWTEGPTNSTIGEQINAWKSGREACRSRAMEFYEIVKDECGRLHRMCERKGEYLRYQRALETVESIFVDENTKREQISGYYPQGYVSLFFKRWKDLETEDDDDAESDIIWSIMKETEAESEIQMAIQRQKNRLAREANYLLFFIHRIQLKLVPLWSHYVKCCSFTNLML
jgi:hypothetical protein